MTVRHRYYALVLLWAAAVLRFVDLQIIAVLLESIRAEFRLDDVRLALLGGAAFALFYGTLGLPVAWLAEHCKRRTLLAAAVSLWSVMTMLCGQATGFLSLFLARMGVGIGEAGGYPPTTSLVADWFPPSQRGRACAVIASAIPVGVLVGFTVGGYVNVHYGWRTALQVAGLPGLLLGLLMLLTLKEPARGDAGRTLAVSSTGFMDNSRRLWRQPGYRSLVAAAALFTLGASGSGLWLPAYFMRHHGLGSAETGLWMAGLYGGGGLLGSLFGGWWAQRRHNLGNQDAYARLCQYSLLLTLPLWPLVLLWPSPHAALCWHLAITLLMHMNIGPVLTLVQHSAGERQRALAHAWLLLVGNTVGLPLGPFLIGWFSDALTPLLGTRALGLGILAVVLASWSLAAVYFGRLAGSARARGNVEGGEALIPAVPGSG